MFIPKSQRPVEIGIHTHQPADASAADAAGISPRITPTEAGVNRSVEGRGCRAGSRQLLWRRVETESPAALVQALMNGGVELLRLVGADPEFPAVVQDQFHGVQSRYVVHLTAGDKADAPPVVPLVAHRLGAFHL